jgi:hypothetical protein
VVGDPGHDIGVHLDPRQVDGLAQHRHLTGRDQLVPHRQVDEVGVQLRRHRVVSAFQNKLSKAAGSHPSRSLVTQ